MLRGSVSRGTAGGGAGSAAARPAKQLRTSRAAGGGPGPTCSWPVKGLVAVAVLLFIPTVVLQHSAVSDFGRARPGLAPEASAAARAADTDGAEPWWETRPAFRAYEEHEDVSAPAFIYDEFDDEPDAADRGSPAERNEPGERASERGSGFGPEPEPEPEPSAKDVAKAARDERRRKAADRAKARQARMEEGSKKAVAAKEAAAAKKAKEGPPKPPGEVRLSRRRDGLPGLMPKPWATRAGMDSVFSSDRCLQKLGELSLVAQRGFGRKSRRADVTVSTAGGERRFVKIAPRGFNSMASRAVAPGARDADMDEGRVTVAISQLDQPAGLKYDSVCPHFVVVHRLLWDCSRLPRAWTGGSDSSRAKAHASFKCYWSEGETCEDGEPDVSLIATEMGLADWNLVSVFSGKAPAGYTDDGVVIDTTRAAIFQALFAMIVAEIAVGLANHDFKLNHLMLDQEEVADDEVWAYHLPGHAEPYFVDAARIGGARLRLIDFHLAVNVFVVTPKKAATSWHHRSWETNIDDLYAHSKAQKTNDGTVTNRLFRSLANNKFFQSWSKASRSEEAAAFAREVDRYHKWNDKTKVPLPPDFDGPRRVLMRNSLEFRLLRDPFFAPFRQRPADLDRRPVRHFGFDNVADVQELVDRAVAANAGLYAGLEKTESARSAPAEWEAAFRMIKNLPALKAKQAGTGRQASPNAQQKGKAAARQPKKSSASQKPQARTSTAQKLAQKIGKKGGTAKPAEEVREAAVKGSEERRKKAIARRREQTEKGRAGRS